MSKRRLTLININELMKNKNVFTCSEKSITYQPDFKIEAVRRYQEEGLTAKEIFRQAGFDLTIIGTDTPKLCLRGWRKVFKQRGKEGLAAERRGTSRGGGKGRPRKNEEDSETKMKRLEATVAYLKAENSFLAKLRAQRKE